MRNGECWIATRSALVEIVECAVSIENVATGIAEVAIDYRVRMIPPFRLLRHAHANHLGRERGHHRDRSRILETQGVALSRTVAACRRAPSTEPGPEPR